MLKAAHRQGLKAAERPAPGQVLNLEMTVAVTHNYCSSATFPRIWAHTHRGWVLLSWPLVCDLRSLVHVSMLHQMAAVNLLLACFRRSCLA